MEAVRFSASGATTEDSIGALPKLPVPLSHPQNGGFTLLPFLGPNYTTQVPCMPLAQHSVQFFFSASTSYSEVLVGRQQ